MMGLKDKENREAARNKLYRLVDTSELEISEAVKLIRKTYGMNQEDYAKKVGVTRKTLSLIETGEGNPGIKLLEKVLSPMKLKLSITNKNN